MGIYNIHIAPIKTGMPEFITDVAELKRFCWEQKLPLFYTEVTTIEYTPGISQEVKPFRKYFTIYNGALFVAKETKETGGA